MAIRNISFATSASVTASIDSLANGSAWGGAAVDNGTNKYVDALLYLAIPLASGSPASDKAINVYFYASEDGTNYTDNSGGTDASITLRSPTNFLGPFVIATPASGSVTYKAVIPSVARMFGGIIPRKWGIVVENRTGLAFGTGSVVTYTGITETIA